MVNFENTIEACHLWISKSIKSCEQISYLIILFTIDENLIESLNDGALIDKILSKKLFSLFSNNFSSKI